ncbi:MAG TPA: ADOP family duplicated permease [Chthoniobacterales bacterium]|nr:ADOP family duplicated permease [Chthoniobacterales bacterium]
MHWEQWLRIVPLRVRSLVRRRQLERELNEELQFHIEQKTLELVAAGLVLAEARRAAVLAVGQIEQCKEECRDTRGVRFLEETCEDLRAAFRSLGKTPGFTILATAMLAIALAANAAVFLLAHALFLDPLPFGVPEARLVLVWNKFASQHLARIPLSAAEVADLQRSAPNLEEAAAFRYTEYNHVGDPRPERIYGSLVSWNLFSVLGVSPLLGRTFTSNDQLAPGPPAVVISEHVWRRRFAAHPGIVEQEIVLSGRPYRVVGVMPATFQFPLDLFDVHGPVTDAAQIWQVIRGAESDTSERSRRPYAVIGRLKPGSSVGALNHDLESVALQWQEQHPQTYRGRGFAIGAHLLREEVIGSTRPAMLVAAAAALLLFVIALANLTALVLARVDRREAELAVRIAAGAGPVRLFRQMATEGFLLAGIGGLLGAVLAVSAIWWWRTAAGTDLPLLGHVSADRRLLFHLLFFAALAGAALAGLPVWRIIHRVRAQRLSFNPPSDDRSWVWKRLRDAFVILEIALAFVLLATGGVLTRSFLRLSDVPLGFDPQSVLTSQVTVPSGPGQTAHSTAEFVSTSVKSVTSLPEVSEAAFTSILPLSGVNADKSFLIDGAPVVGPLPDEEFRIITPRYFATLRIPLLDGRDFTEADSGETAPVVIVNQALAQRYWPGESALGKRIRFAEPATSRWMEIVGVVGNVRHQGLHRPVRPEFYLLHSQMPFPLMTLVVRTTPAGQNLEAAITARIRDVDAEQPLGNFRPLSDLVEDSIAHRRLAVTLVNLFAVIAVFFGAAGVYGVLSNIFIARRRELAMRVALGAPRPAMFRLVFGKSFNLLGAGLLFGFPLALLANYALAPFRYEISAYDPATFVSAAALLTAITFIATFLPAHRAAGVDPSQLLRCD